MIYSLLFCWTLLCFSLVQGFPEGYILKVTADCAETTDSSSTINVLSDLDIYVDLHCRDDFLYEVSTSDGVHHDATVNFTGDTSNECVFMKLNNSDVYTLKLVVGYGEPGTPLRMYTDEYQITCTYDDSDWSNSSAAQVSEGVLAPNSIQQNVGDLATSIFDLEVTDVVGIPITGSIPLGKKIQLKATMSDPTGTAVNEVSAVAVGCSATGNGKEYDLLRGGCGDGVIFNHHAGFTTSGKVLKSPFFSAFHMYGSTVVKFECNFTICASACDGTSCFLANEKKRRRREVDDHLILSETDQSIQNSADGVMVHVESNGYTLRQGSYEHRLPSPHHNGVIKHLITAAKQDEMAANMEESEEAKHKILQIHSLNGSVFPDVLVHIDKTKGLHPCMTKQCPEWQQTLIAVLCALLSSVLLALWYVVKRKSYVEVVRPTSSVVMQPSAAPRPN